MTIKLMLTRNHRLRLSRRLSVIFRRLDIAIDTPASCINQKNGFGESAKRETMWIQAQAQAQALAADRKTKKEVNIYLPGKMEK